MSSPHSSGQPSWRRVLLISAVSLLLASCGGGSGKRAADDVHAFLTAVMADDRQGFDSLVDRRAVRADLRRQVIEIGRLEGLEVEGGPSDFALDRMISPSALRLVQAGDGMVEAPPADVLATRLRVVDKHSVCLPAANQNDRCVLTFSHKSDGTWKLTAMEATGLSARAPTY